MNKRDWACVILAVALILVALLLAGCRLGAFPL